MKADGSKAAGDVYVNLCDGAWDEDRAGMEVVKALEMFKVPFTGASSEFCAELHGPPLNR